MNWYYANAGKQIGPINDADFERLCREGVIQPTTLVWRDGMPQWEPLANVRTPATPLAPSEQPPMPPGQIICSECRKLVPAEETMQVGNAAVCAACKPIYVQKLREGAIPFVSQTAGTRYGGFWIRFVAKFIDSLIVGIPVMILYLVGAFALGFNAFTPQAGPPDMSALLASLGFQLGVQAIGVALGGLYNVFFIVKYAATPGKMAVGLRVIMADGGRVLVGRAIGRYFAEMVSGLACYIGYIIAGFDDQKRSLHDHMCNTRVVYK